MCYRLSYKNISKIFHKTPEKNAKKIRDKNITPEK